MVTLKTRYDSLVAELGNQEAAFSKLKQELETVSVNIHRIHGALAILKDMLKEEGGVLKDEPAPPSATNPTQVSTHPVPQPVKPQSPPVREDDLAARLSRQNVNFDKSQDGLSVPSEEDLRDLRD